MKIHEHQAKEFLSHYGVPTPKGQVAFGVEEAIKAAGELKGERWVLKAQIHAGGRGKGGGVKVCGSIEELGKEAEKMWQMQLITHQTGAEGQQVRRLLVEEALVLRKELYVSILVDRHSQCPMVLASTEGGMDIEAVAAESPEKILREVVDPTVGLRAFQATRLAYGLELAQIDASLVRPGVKLLLGLYEAFTAGDCSLLEINPLAVTGDGRVLALDAKVSFDDNASFRHRDWDKLRDEHEENAMEREAAAADLNYIKLDGNIGCMVNGAGLAMATMDMIKVYGASPANFLDVGGTATAERVATAFRIITSDTNVRAILINIFGGIVRCDLVAEGVVEAFRQVQPQTPVVVRLEGAKVEEAREIIRNSGLQGKLIMAQSLKAAGQQCVQLTQ